MTQQDAQRIGEHCQAQVASDQFTPRLEAAYDVIANVPEYQNMTGACCLAFKVSSLSLHHLPIRLSSARGRWRNSCSLRSRAALRSARTGERARRWNRRWQGRETDDDTVRV